MNNQIQKLKRVQVIIHNRIRYGIITEIAYEALLKGSLYEKIVLSSEINPDSFKETTTIHLNEIRSI